MYFHASYDLIVDIFSYRSNVPNATRDVVVTEMTEYMTKSFQGILYYFQLHIKNSDSERQLKKRTLQSLGKIIQFMGSERITPNRFKILTLLNTATNTNEDELRDVILEVWTIFLCTIDVHQIGSLLSSIFVSLIPLMAHNQCKINEIFTNLLCSNESLLSSFFSSLYFIEHIDEVDASIKSLVKRHTKENNSLVEQLSEYLIHIQHENVMVRSFGLKNLLTLIKKNRDQLNSFVVSRNTVLPVLVNILKSLMNCCKENDQDLQVCAAQCLGELGALEPTLMPTNYEPQNRFTFNVFTDEFAIMVLKELCRAYQVQVDANHVDCFALAIQEVLVSHNVNPRTHSKMNIWEAIPSRMWPIIESLLDSSYSGVKSNDSQPESHPIYGSTQNLTFEEWVFRWATSMINKIKDERTNKLLDAFRFSIKKNINTMSLIFPYIVLHSIQNCSPSDVTLIHDEMITVFASVAADERPVEEQPAETDEEASSAISQETQLHLEIPNSVTYDGDIVVQDDCSNMKYKCARAGFGVLDFLQQWTREYLKNKPKEETNVSKFDSLTYLVYLTHILLDP